MADVIPPEAYEAGEAAAGKLPMHYGRARLTAAVEAAAPFVAEQARREERERIAAWLPTIRVPLDEDDPAAYLTERVMHLLDEGPSDA